METGSGHSEENGEDESAGTWLGIKLLAEQGAVQLDRCFFTNALLGVRDDTNNDSVTRKIKITGCSPALRHDPFVQESLGCLEAQITALQPSVIVALGVVPATLLIRRWKLAPPPWPNKKRTPGSTRLAAWSEIDGSGLQAHAMCSVASLPQFAFATSVHPSMQNQADRVWVRRSETLSGTRAQMAIWQTVRDFDAEVQNNHRGVTK